MCKDTGQKASAAVKQDDKQEAECHRTGHLEQGLRKARPAAVDQIQQVSQAKVRLEMTTAVFLLSSAIARNRSPLKITSSTKPTQSIQMI